MGRMEEFWSGNNYVRVTTSAANSTNPILGSGVLAFVTVNAAPTSAITIYDGANSTNGALILTIPATTAAGTHWRYDLQYGSNGIAVSAGSSDTNVILGYHKLQS